MLNPELDNIKIKSVTPISNSDHLSDGQYDGWLITILTNGTECQITVTADTPFEMEPLSKANSMDDNSLLSSMVERLRAFAAL